jgi:long-chain acyl-CoA synthetase
MGVEKGDRVSLLLPNVPQFIIAYNAVLALGGVVVAINPLNSKQEIEREIIETESEGLIILDKLLHKLPDDRYEKIVVAEAAAYAPRFTRLLSHLRSGSQEAPTGALSFEGLLSGRALDELVEVNPKDDLAAILYTSGTTGHPKGVMLTHYNLVANTLQSYHWLRGWGFSAKEQSAGWPVVLCAMPFFHSYGMTVAMNESVQFGCTMVLVPEPRAEILMKSIQQHRVTHFPAIPRFIGEILNHPDLSRYDLTSLTSCLSGGASIDPSLVERFVKLSDASFYLGYGLTEAGPCTHCTPIDDEPKTRSAGMPFMDTEAKIVDLQLGEFEMKTGERGELIIRGPQVMKGYLNSPEETSRVLRDGWLYTGDIARMDEEGYIYIVGRKRERILAEGHTVWPSEVEEVLTSHQKVEAAIAIGVLDPLRCSTDLQALVTLKPGVDKESLEDELLDCCRERLEDYKIPASVRVVDYLPMTTMGKVDRMAVEAETKSKS